MAERSNAEKLAAGRRKLKEFQQKCKERSPVQNKKSREVDGKDDVAEGSTTINNSRPSEVMSSIEHSDGTPSSFVNSDASLELSRNRDTLIMIESKPDHLSTSEIHPVAYNKINENGGCEDLGQNVDSHPSSSPEKSSTEALRQLSMQMDGLVADSLLLEADAANSQLSRNNRVDMDVELLNRNQELAGLLEEEKRQADSLKVQLKECKSRINQLETEKESWVSESNLRLEREMRPLREQLQLHVQTVGVLVGEKTELSAALSRSQNVARQKTELVEELQTKLRDSQVRLTELVRELSAANEDRGILKQQVLKGEEDVAKYSAKMNEMSSQLEEQRQEVSEVRQKLSIRSNGAVSMQKELEDVKSKLLLSRLRLRQLTGSAEGMEDPSFEHTGKDEAAESWHQHRIHLERQNEDLKKAAQEAIEEREEASRRFQTYIHTLNGQMEGLARKVETLTAENTTLAGREQSLVSHLSELEKQLQKVSNKTGAKDEENAASEYRISLENKCIALQEQLDGKVAEVQVLENKLEALENKFQEAMNEVQGRRNESDESAEKDEPKHDEVQLQMLMAAMESDKVAASRAVDQNVKLKAQLAELQDAFVKLSNDKLVLTEKLNNVQYLSKDQAEKFSKLEEQFLEFRTKQEMEKEESQKSISDLESKIISLEQERDHLFKELKSKEGKENSDELSSVNVNHSSEQESHQVNGESGNVDSKGNDQSLSESEAVQKLEERFRITMEELATLTDEKQRLEHLVLQLQGETETIGEYVALYQTQRGLLRQRAREKDEQLVKLSKDREELRSKLGKLETLVHKLLNEEAGKGNNAIETEVAIEAGSEAVGSQEVENNSSESYITKKKEAAQILALLSEIGSNSSLNETSLPSTFHPCPWCSGQLITV
ncbi:golgin subfamily A member 2-like [Ischnura elegans]|uniref:golgin subfamily A member 2-like n=1 Tax=Ischnura elegans TaxID=197161 RepID=UPI001ED8ABC8|nr:golgin subfamily A member 2-like [Ischnura elegans]